MISVIIPSYNSSQTIQRCLDALLQQTYRRGYEIILVDSSSDATPQIVALNYPKVKCIHLEKKTDPGTARNIGLGEAHGNVIAFIDSDCVARPDWLEKIECAHRSPYKVVGGVVKNDNEENDLIAWAGYMAEFREFLPNQPKREVMHIPTCNISYKIEVFREFGLFQGKYYPQEDLVYNYTLRENGEKILLDPAIQVYHHHRTRLRDFLYHQNKIGKITARVLKETQLEGAFIVRHPLLAIFLLPFLPMVKFIRTLLVFCKQQPEVITKRPLTVGIFALGLLFWGIGFARGVYEKDLSIN